MDELKLELWKERNNYWDYVVEKAIKIVNSAIYNWQEERYASVEYDLEFYAQKHGDRSIDVYVNIEENKFGFAYENIANLENQNELSVFISKMIPAIEKEEFIVEEDIKEFNFSVSDEILVLKAKIEL